MLLSVIRRQESQPAAAAMASDPQHRCAACTPAEPESELQGADPRRLCLCRAQQGRGDSRQRASSGPAACSAGTPKKYVCIFSATCTQSGPLVGDGHVQMNPRLLTPTMNQYCINASVSRLCLQTAPKCQASRISHSRVHTHLEPRQQLQHGVGVTRLAASLQLASWRCRWGCRFPMCHQGCSWGCCQVASWGCRWACSFQCVAGGAAGVAAKQGWARRLWFKSRDVSFASFSRLL
eukprot:364996-Chlamydomonas_euryale.AAC.4